MRIQYIDFLILDIVISYSGREKNSMIRKYNIVNKNYNICEYRNQSLGLLRMNMKMNLLKTSLKAISHSKIK